MSHLFDGNGCSLWTVLNVLSREAGWPGCVMICYEVADVRRDFSSRGTLGAILMLLLASAAVRGSEPSSQTITPNFKDAHLTQVAEAVSVATGKNFIIDPRVRG